MPPDRVLLLVATRKGAFIIRTDAAREDFAIDGPHFLGHTIHHMRLDPRDGNTILMAARTGHLGPTVFQIRLGSLDRFQGANLFHRGRGLTSTSPSRLFRHIRIHLSHTAFPAIKCFG